MEILDPDLWNDDGTPKRPSEQYMKSLGEVQDEQGGVFLNYARIKREARANRSPEIGDIVHFWQNGTTCRVGIVMETESFTDGACLRVHIPHEPFQDWQSDHDEAREAPNTWHWPCGEGQ